MNDLNPGWLVTNASSGSNAADALDALEDCGREHRRVLTRRMHFPEQVPQPTEAEFRLVPCEVDLIATETDGS